MNLSKEIRSSLVQAPLAAAGTNLASKFVDMSGFEGVLFTGLLGTPNSTSYATLAAWESTSTGSTGRALAGATISSTAGEADKLMQVDVFRPVLRYVKTHLTRTGASIEYGGTLAQQYGPATLPTTQKAAHHVATPVLKFPVTT